MAAMCQHDGWVRGLIAKHPIETLRLLALLANAGLSRGTASANDLPDAKFAHPNVVGAAFKLLHKLGFAKTGRILPATRPSSHGRFVLEWRLADARRAEEFVRSCRGLLLRQEAMTCTEQLLPM
jgi:hypothetical protein